MVGGQSKCRARGGAGTQYSLQCTRLEPVVVVPIKDHVLQVVAFDEAAEGEPSAVDLLLGMIFQAQAPLLRSTGADSYARAASSDSLAWRTQTKIAEKHFCMSYNSPNANLNVPDMSAGPPKIFRSVAKLTAEPIPTL